MTSARRWMPGSLALLSAVAVPLACADEGDLREGPAAPDGSTDGSAAGDDGAVDARSSEPAKDCSASGICVTRVPVDGDVQITSVWGSGASDVWAVGSGGTILHFDGASWEKASQTVPDGSLAYTLRSVWLERPDDVWMLDGPRIRHSTGWKGPDATEWSFYTAPQLRSPAALGGRETTVWITGSILSSIDKYEGWGEGGPLASDNLAIPVLNGFSRAIAVTGRDEIWVSGVRGSDFGGGGVVRGSRSASGAPDASTVWDFEEHDSRTTANLLGAWGDEGGVWLVGGAGTIRRMTRSAVSTKRFEVVPSPTTANLLGVFGFGADDVWAVGEGSTVMRWDGASWSRLSTPFDDAEERPTFFAVWGSSPSDVWIAASGTLLHFHEGEDDGRR